MQAQAISKYNRISHKKLLRITRKIGNNEYQKALETLSFLPHKGARILENTLKSAGSNLKQKDSSQSNENKYFILSLEVQKGPILKRIRPRARGRADRIDKRTCHLKITVSNEISKTLSKKKQTPSKEPKLEEPKPEEVSTKQEKKSSKTVKNKKE